MKLTGGVAALPLDEGDMVEHYGSLVNRIAHHIASRLPANILVDDLIQAGMIGLLEASRNFDDKHNASFETYAGIRIRGAILDEIRRNDWAPRSVHRNTRMVAQAVREIEEIEGRDARAQEIADKLGVSLQAYHQMLADSSGQRVLSMEESVVGDETLGDTISDNAPSIYDGLHEEDIIRSVAEAISSLPERERLVVALYYDEELNLKEIGSVLSLSESRICQIHNQAVLRLQARLSGFIKLLRA